MSASFGKAQSNDASRFLQRQMEAWLLSLSFPAYCALIRLLLSRSGYATVRALDENTATGAGASGRRYSGTGGLDLLAFAHTDMATFLTAVGLRTGRVPLGRRFVDELRGAMARVGAEQGLLFTTATVSSRTRQIAATAGLSPVHIIAGENLAAMLIERRIGVRRVDNAHSTDDSHHIEDQCQFDARFFEDLEARSQIRPRRGRPRLT